MLLNNANAHLDGSIVTCDKRIDLFLSAFPMFVPSLSWSNDAFLVSNGIAKLGGSIVTSKSGLKMFRRRWPKEVSGFPQKTCQVRKTPLFSQLSLCLSRVCLGKMMHLKHKWHLKNGVFRSW
jgi:hypothetical protein